MTRQAKLTYSLKMKRVIDRLKRIDRDLSIELEEALNDYSPLPLDREGKIIVMGSDVYGKNLSYYCKALVFIYASDHDWYVSDGTIAPIKCKDSFQHGDTKELFVEDLKLSPKEYTEKYNIYSHNGDYEKSMINSMVARSKCVFAEEEEVPWN